MAPHSQPATSLSYLLNLPLELRSQIYDYTLESPEPCHIDGRCSRVDPPEHPLTVPSLLLVSHQVYTEAIQLYRKNYVPHLRLGISRCSEPVNVRGLFFWHPRQHDPQRTPTMEARRVIIDANRIIEWRSAPSVFIPDPATHVLTVRDAKSDLTHSFPKLRELTIRPMPTWAVTQRKDSPDESGNTSCSYRVSCVMTILKIGRTFKQGEAQTTSDEQETSIFKALHAQSKDRVQALMRDNPKLFKNPASFYEHELRDMYWLRPWFDCAHSRGWRLDDIEWRID